MFIQEGMIDLGSGSGSNSFHSTWSGDFFTYVIIDQVIHFTLPTPNYTVFVNQNTGNVKCGCLGDVKSCKCTICGEHYLFTKEAVKIAQNTDLSADVDHVRRDNQRKTKKARKVLNTLLNDLNDGKDIKKLAGKIARAKDALESL